MFTTAGGLMRAFLILVGLLTSAVSHAQGLAGVFFLDTGAARITARFDVSGDRITGVLEAGDRTLMSFAGKSQGSEASGTASSPDGEASFTMRVVGDVLDLELSQPDGPGQRAATLPLRLTRVGTPAEAGAALAGDSRLVGRWSSQDVIVSGNASMASETLLLVRPDGTYALARGRSVAGGTDWSFDGGPGEGVEQGRWRAENRALFVEAQGGQWVRIGTYGMTEDGNTLRIIDERGDRTLWSRRSH
jgi:hypothetical protein